LATAQTCVNRYPTKQGYSCQSTQPEIPALIPGEKRFYSKMAHHTFSCSAESLIEHFSPYYS